MSSISCKIRGVRDPRTRKNPVTNNFRKPEPQVANPYFDDGTRIVRIIGCDYKLSESEITDWLTQFGEVISEITEEQFNNGEALDEDVEKMPPVGNGTYIVTMKLRKDLPNWVPMYGRRVRFEYRGIKKQCSGCYGPHIKKFCKYDWMSMEEYK